LLSLRLDPLLSSLIGPSCKEPWFLDRLRVCKNLEEYVHEMQQIVDMLAKETDASQQGQYLSSNSGNGNTLSGVGISGSISNMAIHVSRNTPLFGQWVCEAIAVVGYDKLVHVESDFSRLILRAVDSTGRRVHEYSILFSQSNSTTTRPSLDTSLPVTVDYSWRGDGNPASVKDVVYAVEREITIYEAFFQVIKSIFCFQLRLLLL
jgi:hypothetical protein